MLGFLFQLKTYSALRARLAALLVLVLLGTGMFGARAGGAEPGSASGTLRRVEASLSRKLARPSGLLMRTGARPRGETASNRRAIGARPPHSGEVRAYEYRHAVARTDAQKAPPRAARSFFNKVPSEEDAADEEADAAARYLGYHTRAPPNHG